MEEEERKCKCESEFQQRHGSVCIGIVGSEYCVNYPIDLAIMKNIRTLSDGNFTVIDMNGNIVFTLKGKTFTLHDRRILLDDVGNPVVTLAKKIRSLHERWKVFRGGSTEDEDMIFSVKRASMRHKTKLEVFLAKNTEEEVCDYVVKGSWFERSCVVYAGQSDTIVAQMHTRSTIQSIMLGKEKFMVTVKPNIDQAFAIALIVILEEINDEDDD